MSDLAAAGGSVLVSQGQLWETLATSARGRASTTMPVTAAAFQEAQRGAVGSQLRIELSPQIPALAAEVSARSVADDGTTVTRLRISGAVPGTLILQENVANDFFIGQLYYDGLAVAYEFHTTAEGLSATRHPVSDLLCAIVSARGGDIESLGLPVVDKGKARHAEDQELANNDENPIQEGKATLQGPTSSPTLSINDVAALEGNSGTGKLLFTVKLSKADTKKVITVKYATANGSAMAGSDYTAVAGTLSFPKGSTTQTVAVTVTGDTDYEADETFTLKLSSPVSATLADASGMGTILNDDSPPVVTDDATLSLNDVAVLEGNSGSSNLVFTVNLSKADSTRTISVNYASADASATAGADYTAVAGTLSFPIGSTTQTVAVAITGDDAYEADETFTLNLSNPVNATLADASGAGTILNDDSPPSGAPVLNSLPGAGAVAYLDMDGQVDSSLVWSTTPITARGIATSFTQEQMAEIWRRTAEDYAAFQINVTTEESVYLATAANRRIRCIITPDNEWYGAAGGVAYVNSFTWTGDTPCWVFSDQLANTPRYIAESCAHEIGHTLGLGHDGRISPAETYYQGQGAGEVGWAPIMGVGYYKTLVQWSKGEYLSSNNSQDDLAIITTKNGFGYRVDQHADTAAGATALTVSGNAVSGSGIIETRSDVDVFSFATGGGTVTLNVSGDATSQNLDILAEIKDAGGNTLATGNPDLLTDASVSANLAAGTYFLHVSGVGRGDYLVDGYTDYGSIGQYAITGSVH